MYSINYQLFILQIFFLKKQNKGFDCHKILTFKALFVNNSTFTIFQDIEIPLIFRKYI